MKRRMLKKKFNIALLVITFAILTLSFTAFAAEQEFKVTTNVTNGYTYSDGLLKFVKGGEYTIEMAEGVTQTTHKIEVNQTEIYNDTKRISLKFSNLNMITNTGDNIRFLGGFGKEIDINIEIDGTNIITNTCVSINNKEGCCIRNYTNYANTTVKGNGKLTLQAADDYPSWNGKTFTLDSDSVTLDFKNHAIMAQDGIYIRSGNVDITSHEQCLYTEGEIIISGGKINATHTGEKTCVRSRGLEISGGDLSFSISSSAPSAPKAVVAVDNTNIKIGKSVNISGDASIMIDGAGKRVAGILLMKITDMFSMNGANLTIKNVTTGLYRSNAYSKCTFSGGETEIITSAAAIYSAIENNNYFLSFDDNYRHQTYEGSNEQDRGLTDDDKLLKGTNRKNSRKYVLITPAYDITYDLDGGFLPPNANPTRYTRVDGITLTNPTQYLKEFVGWTGSNGTVPQKNVTIPVGSKGNLEYKANWDNLPYSVYFYSNYEPGTYNTQTFKYDESEKLDANSFTRAGYIFTGWNTEGQPTTEKPGIHYDDQAELNISISNRLTEDSLSLWAQWNPIPAQPPTIITQPQNLDLIVGYSEGKISIQAKAAENHTITGYQWYSTSTGNVEDGVPIVNATTADYMIPTGKDVGKEYYYCIVTATRNDNGQTAAVTSNVATVTINPKQAQTIAAKDVTAIFGDTDKSVSARVTDPATGGGEISYAVKPGSEEYIEVDSSNGALTIKKAGTATVVVTAAETSACARATKEVQVTISPKSMQVNASGYTGYYDGTAHGITVSVTEPASGYRIKYGIVEGEYSLEGSPTQTEAGTKTVYYQVTADNYITYTGNATITINAKQAQTIAAKDVTAIFGDTDKSVSARVTDPATGGGEISYAVKSGSEEYIEVDLSNGALTIKKAGTAIVVVTAAETSAYARATKEVQVTISPKSMRVSASGYTGYYDGTAHGITVSVTEPASGYGIKYGMAEGTYNLDSSPTQMEAGTKTVYYQVTADNYITCTGNATITINAKQAQTITTEDVTAKFGDAGKSVSATVTDPATGGGEISYAVKPGSEEYIEVDPSNGALRLKKAGTAIVVVTAAETPTYAETTKEVIVTINKVFPTVNVPIAKELTYTGSAQQLVEAGSAIGGTMQYALGTATGPAFPFSITVPTETAAGTYYVWYRVIGDANHLNTEPAVIPVTISAIDEYVIIFNTDGGTGIPPQMVKRGERIIKPENPVKQGYTFIQWMNGQQPYDFSEPVTENLTLAAQWKESGTYLFTVGQDSSWQKESGITLKFQAHHTVDDQDTYKKFSFIEIDGKKISPENYEKKSDGIIIELKPDFLELLDLGKHILRLVFLDGSVDTSFEIVPREEKEEIVPDTGDRDYLWKWMGLAAFCLIGIILLRRTRGK